MLGIDIFAGAGGMSLGAEMAGIRVQVAVEVDRHAAKTYAKNHPGTYVINQDIRTVELPLPVRGEGPIILFGGPPCQGFSTSNQRTRSAANPHNWLYREFFRMVQFHEPDWVVFENVKGIKETASGMFLRDIEDHFRQLGYNSHSFVLNAKHFGVPQNRDRLFVVATKWEGRFPIPTGTHGRPVTVREAIFDLPELKPGACFEKLPYKTDPHSDYARAMRGGIAESTGHLVSRNNPVVIERYRHVPQGGNWEDIPEHLMANYTDRSRCHTGIYRRLRADEPSVVIGNYRKNMLIHPIEHRGLSVREAARLQSFPDRYEFMGSIGFQQQQVGNAVPPLLAKAVFEAIMEVERKLR